jgi:hypothetical protein
MQGKPGARGMREIIRLATEARRERRVVCTIIPDAGDVE